MKALSISEKGQSTIVELEKPVCGSNQVLIKLAYVAFCGSDLSTYQGRNPMVSYPRVPGHEISGTVEGFGSEVTHLTKGAKVTVIPYTACGECPSCKRGRSNACRSNQTLGVQREGAMTEYIAIDSDKVLLVDQLNLDELALVEPLTVGFHSVDRAEVTDQDTVLVFGCGMIGLGAIAAAVHRGANVIAVDIADDKLNIAKKIGANHTIHSINDNLIEKVNSITDGDLADVVIEAVGHPITYKSAIDVVAFAGRISCIGYAQEDVAFTTKYFVQKELDIRGSRNATRKDFENVIQYLSLKTFPLSETITEKVSLSDAPQALDKWSQDPSVVTKIIVKF